MMTMHRLFTTTTLSLLLLPSVLGASSLAPLPSDLQVRPNDGETVLSTGTMQVLEGLAESGNTLLVESNVPVIAERLTAGSAAFLEPPLPWQSAVVIVKSQGCPEGASVDVEVVNATLAGGDYSLQVTVSGVPSSSGFLDSSALFRQLACASQFAAGPSCPTPAPKPEETTDAPAAASEGTTSAPVTSAPETSPVSAATSKASLLLSLLLVGVSTFFSCAKSSTTRGPLLFVAMAAMGGAVLYSYHQNSPSSVSRRTLLEECTVNVEVAYWGCNTYLHVTAPNLILRNLQQETTQDRENCNCTSLAYFPDLDDPRDEPLYNYMDFDADNNITTSNGDGTQQQVALADASNCRLAIGRPFRDEQGASIVAKSVVVEAATDDAPWSARLSPSLWNHYNSVPPPEPPLHNHELAHEWTTRALGEHASVASFSAFTIALMANGAPPRLLEASLRAAQDELRHAQISFQVASLWRGSSVVIEPSALPSSHHQFGSNWTALALGVIQEGCIEETISALKMAADYDRAVHQAKDDEDLLWMWNITKTIALEEARHSILAWRTVQWICQETDATICSNLLPKERFQTMGQTKHAMVSRAWGCLAAPLACHVRSDPSCATQACHGLPPTSLVAELVEQITRSVVTKAQVEY